MASESSIHKALDKALKSGASMCFEASTDKLIIFSDHHRGRRDGADDFLICESNYYGGAGVLRPERLSPDAPW
jgi:hypothetical protein